MMVKFKKIVQTLVNLLGYEISFMDRAVETEFEEIYKICKNFTATSKERMYALYKAIEYIVNSKIPGDFVECGVLEGGSAMVIAHTLIKMGETNRKIYLYDTFEGMSKPSGKDRRISDGTSAISKWKKQQKKGHNKWCFVSLSKVKKNLFSTRYPQKNLIFIKGKVEDTIPEYIPSKIAILRLDTDWYESTKHELNYLYPLLIKHGVLIIDDYGHWAGCKKAVDEYFIENNISILLNRIDYGGRIGIKNE